MQPLLSIITVTKNCASTIGRTLQSVQAIKSSDIEYIVVDGESTDGTLEIVRQCHDLVDVLKSESDNGVYSAMNKGATIATGQYVLFLNGDDRIVADGFSRALDILRSEHPKILSCQSNVCWRNEHDVEILAPRPYLLPFFNAIPHLSTFISTSIQRRFTYREDLKIASDYDLFLKLFIRGYYFTVSNLITAVHYRGGGLSADRAQSAIEIETVKRENLGCFYFIIKFLEWLNQRRKGMCLAR
jgi:glycosyltransferase involved in cell wall biosynthesis